MSITRRDLIRTSLASAAALAGGALLPSLARGAAPRPKTPLRLLILGGTGFLGPEIVAAARERGHALTLFNRGRTNPNLFPDIEKLRGDRDGDLEALKARAWDAVIDTSGYVPRVVGASASLLAPSVGHYVFISTLSVFGDTTRPGLDESSPVAQLPAGQEATEEVMTHYGALKAACERAAEAAMPGRVTNVRPALIVGPGDPTDRFTYWPARLAEGGEVLAPGDGRDPVQFIDVRDLAAWLVRLVEAKDMGTFNAPGPAKKTTMADLLASIQSGTRSRARLTWVDTPFLDEKSVAAWSDLPAWVPASGDTLGFARISNAKALAHGLTFRPASETARDTLAWWSSLPAERRAAPKAGLTRDREREVLAAWHARASAKKPSAAAAGGSVGAATAR